MVIMKWRKRRNRRVSEKRRKMKLLWNTDCAEHKVRIQRCGVTVPAKLLESLECAEKAFRNSIINVVKIERAK
jgi:hypothetical protein